MVNHNNDDSTVEESHNLKSTDEGVSVAAHNRRCFLGGAAAGAVGAAVTGAVLLGGKEADKVFETPPDKIYPFHGQYQAGIFSPPAGKQQAASSFVACDVIAKDKAGVVELFHILTRLSRALTAGGPAPDAGVSRPAADNAVLGMQIPADGLTITVGVGASLFDERYGLAGKKPAKLTAMKTFVNDFLEPSWCHGDLLLQICADHADTVHHALRVLLRETRGLMQMRWRMEGYGSPPRPDGAPRNLLGFKDGSANPEGQQAQDLVWISPDSGEPDWAVNGTYMVVRLIRMLVEFWDRISINEQERIFGRRRDSGAPLDGINESDIPHYAQDLSGAVIPVDAHIRLANPRASDGSTEKNRLLRRSYNYDLGIDGNGNMQAGHIFVCYQQDVVRQFETVQLRLANEPLIDYVQPFGGGYFLVLPGVKATQDWFGRKLLS